jgi:hypothetical protein
MSKNVKIVQIKDTIPQPEGIIISNQSLDGSLKVERQTIELGSVRSFDLDSLRIATKKAIPIIKTVPMVSANDTIVHPEYNVFSRQFDFPREKSLFDKLYFSPFEPVDQLSRKPIVVSPSITHDSLFVVKEDPLVKKIELSKRENTQKGFGSSDWMVGVIIVSLILFGWLRFGFGKFVNAAIQAATSFFAARRIKDEANVLRNRVFVFINILFFINLSLFIVQFISFNDFSIPYLEGIVLFFAILGAVMAIYLIKGMFLQLLDFFFLTKGLFSYYNSTVFIYNRMVGLFLLPIISIVPFISIRAASVLFLAGFIGMGLFYLLRIFRGLQIGFKNRLSIFYLILYLCALEILPILVVYKLVVSQ